jgi:hypothetical protein
MMNYNAGMLIIYEDGIVDIAMKLCICIWWYKNHVFKIIVSIKISFYYIYIYIFFLNIKIKIKNKNNKKHFHRKWHGPRLI